MLSNSSSSMIIIIPNTGFLSLGSTDNDTVVRGSPSIARCLAASRTFTHKTPTAIHYSSSRWDNHTCLQMLTNVLQVAGGAELPLRTTVLRLITHYISTCIDIIKFSFFWSVSWPGIQSGPLAVKVWSPNHWTTKEFPQVSKLYRT